MPKRLLIHIGYHKTATTWMQRLLFMPVHGYYPLASHEQIFEHITAPHGLYFDPKPMQRLIAEGLVKMPLTGVPVVSSEILSGNLFFGGRESEAYAVRLKSIAPDARNTPIETIIATRKGIILMAIEKPSFAPSINAS